MIMISEKSVFIEHCLYRVFVKQYHNLGEEINSCVYNLILLS